ncbi:unnamed protein product [Caenorhabditis sp. 36 PRJEB53466]|nr:unnamed protein product [Caenorhabditis sp. 36 PRJEB53466]
MADNVAAVAQDVPMEEIPAADAAQAVEGPLAAASPAEEVPVEQKAPVMFKLVSSDGVMLEMTESALRHAITLRNVVDVLGYTAENVLEKEPIPLKNVDSKSLKLVIEWCEHYKDTRPAEDKGDDYHFMSVPVWDRGFLDIDKKDLFDLLNAANYLNVVGLLDVACKTVANMLKGKSTEEMREIFEIMSDAEADQLKLAGQSANAAEPSN